MDNDDRRTVQHHQRLLTVLLADDSTRTVRAEAVAGLLGMTAAEVEQAVSDTAGGGTTARRWLRAELGSLQAAILESLVALGGEATTREIVAELANRDHEVVYNTAMSTLGVLHKRGLVDRQRTGRAYTYRCEGLADVARRHISVWLRELLSDPVEDWELEGVAAGLRAAGVTRARFDTA